MLTWAINEGRKSRKTGKGLMANPYSYKDQPNEAQSWQWGWEN